ncbi:MAG: carboxypeptidase regulatory-like domain-containing protein [Bryobacteraceae bacterium]
MYSRILLLLSAAAITAPASAGVISGKVIDSTGATLTGAAVLLEGSTTATFTDDSGVFRLSNVAPGTYRVVISLTGFETVRRENIVVRDDRPADMVVLLPMDFSVEEIVVGSVTSAASNRAPYLPQSGIAPGSVFVGYGSNVGPDALMSAPVIPLKPMLDSFTVTVEANSRQYDCFPIYTSRNQFAAVMNSAVPPGTGMLRVGFNGRMSAPFPVHIPAFQPAVFEGADGRGILTRPDFSLITPEQPAKPGDVVIVWGTGWGAAPGDDRPVTFDKRPNLAGLELSLGGVTLPDSSIFYLGSGGFPGGDQIVITVPELGAGGCGVPFGARRRPTSAGDQGSGVGLTTFPISIDGRPCGDRHGLESGEVATLERSPLSLVTTRFTEATVFDGATRSNGVFATFSGQRLDSRTYRGPAPFGTCGYAWTPANSTPPGQPLAFTGTATMAFPNTQIQFQPLSTFGPYAQALPLSPAPGDGAYRITLSPDFTVDGAPWGLSWGGEYVRRSGGLIERVRSGAQQMYENQRPSRVQQLLDLVETALGEPRPVGLEYGMRVDGGPVGFHEMRCFVSGDLQALSASRNSLAAQEEAILHLFPADTERRVLYVRSFDLDSNKTRREGPVNLTNEVFDAEIDFDLLAEDYRLIRETAIAAPPPP